MRSRVMFALFVVAGLLSISPAARADETASADLLAPAAEDSAALESGGPTLHDPADPASPYASQIADWDLWMYEHAAVPDFEQKREYFAGERPPTQVWSMVMTDAAGYVLPWLAVRKQLFITGMDNPQSAEDCQYVSDVWGEMPVEMFERMQAAEIALLAPMYPPIPQWLADAPPIWARIWPDGRVSTHGALGSWPGHSDLVLLADDRWTYTPEPYFLFNSDGSLVASTSENSREYDLFAGSYRRGDALDGLFYRGWLEKSEARGYSRGWKGMFFQNEYIVWLNPSDHSLIEAYDLDGTCHGPDFDLWARQPGSFGQITGDLLPRLYEAQQR